MGSNVLDELSRFRLVFKEKYGNKIRIVDGCGYSEYIKELIMAEADIEELVSQEFYFNNGICATDGGRGN